MHHCYNITESDYDYIFTFTDELYTFMHFYKVNWHPFISACKVTFSISYKAGLVVMNFLNFCLFEKDFIRSSFLKDSSADTVFFIDIFSFQYFGYIVPLSPGLQSFSREICLWFYRVSLECDKSLFSCCFQNSVIDFRQFNYNGSQSLVG